MIEKLAPDIEEVADAEGIWLIFCLRGDGIADIPGARQIVIHPGNAVGIIRLSQPEQRLTGGAPVGIALNRAGAVNRAHGDIEQVILPRLPVVPIAITVAIPGAARLIITAVILICGITTAVFIAGRTIIPITGIRTGVEEWIAYTHANLL